MARGVPRTPPLRLPLQALAGSGLAGLEGRAAADPLTEHLCAMVDRKRESFLIHMLWTRTTENIAFITIPGFRLKQVFQMLGKLPSICNRKTAP